MKRRLKPLAKNYELTLFAAVILLLVGSLVITSLFEVGQSKDALIEPADRFNFDPALTTPEQTTLRETTADVERSIEVITGRKTSRYRIYFFKSTVGLEGALEVEGRPLPPVRRLVQFVSAGERPATLAARDIYVNLGYPGMERPAGVFGALATTLFRLHEYEASNANLQLVPYWLTIGASKYFADVALSGRFADASAAERSRWEAAVKANPVSLATLNAPSSFATTPNPASEDLAAAAIAFFARRQNDSVVLKFWDELSAGDGWEQAFKRAFGFDVAAAYQQFDQSRQPQ